MNALPVIARELRGESRQPLNYWLRVFSAAAVIIVFVGFSISNQSVWTKGAELFTYLHATVLISIWVLVPTMTADCIAREKREGTLGLLFLTPLKAGEIIIGKSFVHALRALTLFLAVLPMLAMPLLIGGVAWLDIYTGFVFEFCSLLLALAAGILASTFGTIWGRTLLLANFFAIGMFILFGAVMMFLFAVNIWNVFGQNDFSLIDWRFWIIFPVAVLSGLIDGTWSNALGSLPAAATAKSWPIFIGTSFIAALGFLVAALAFASRRLGRCWQEEPPSVRQVWWWKTFCTPQFLQKFFRGRMRRALDRNPIGWLHQYSWSARLIKWGWFLGIVVLETVVLAIGGYYDFDEAQIYVTLTVLAGLSLTAAGSFRRERETGALELLLVTPLKVSNVIWGRVRGIYGQFVLTMAFLALGWMMVWIPVEEMRSTQVFFWMSVMPFFTLPIIGLYCSLTMRNFLVAWLSTLAYGVLLPLLLAGFVFIFFVLGIGERTMASLVGWFACCFAGNFLTIWFIYKRLYQNLDQRQFSFRGN